MYRGKFDEQLKADFFKAFLVHRDEGCSIRNAYRKAREDFLNAHKLAPSLATFASWYNKAMGQERSENAGKPAAPEKEQGTGSLPSEASAAEGPTEPAADYTGRLEMIVRLYRTRSEGAIDALCDYLLPELAGETEAQ